MRRLYTLLAAFGIATSSVLAAGCQDEAYENEPYEEEIYEENETFDDDELVE